ncbi:MAG: hypothetical protein ACLTYF_29140 [Escherichia sp.]
MGTVIKELVQQGHDLAAELNASCGAVDVRSVAQLISDLASQLDCTALALHETQKQRDASEQAERVWEAAMMQVCGEDGPKSVADKFAELQAKCAALAADSKKLKRISKAIRLLGVVKSRQRWHSNCRAQMLHLRNGTDGILGATDEHAIAYSNIDMRREFLQSVLDDRPVNWAYARYLENGEWLERCNISRKAFYAQLRQEAAQ